MIRVAWMIAGAAAAGVGQLRAAATGETPGRVISPNEAMSLAVASRISDMGPDGDIASDASMPAVAYSATDHAYLVAWEGDDAVDALVDDEIEIRAQLIDAVTEEPLGADFRVSHMGRDGDAAFSAHHPAVAHDSTSNRYLVVWHGNDGSGAMAPDETEIWGQLLDASGAAIGAPIRISAAGPDGDATFTAIRPAVAFSAASNEYLVVWEADVGAAAAGEVEIFGQLVSAAGLPTGPDDFRISDMGPNGNAGYDALNAAVAWNHVADEYLVAWDGDDNTGGVVANEFEIFGQFIEASTGQQLGPNDFRISVTGPDAAAEFDATAPALAFNAADDEYLVAWQADGPPLADNKLAIRGQRIDAITGARLEPGDLLIGAMGDPGAPALDAESPAVTCNATDHTYLVVWHADDLAGGLVDNELEIYGRLVPMAGAPFRLSDMGTDDGDDGFDARMAAVAFNGTDGDYLVVWEGDDDTGDLADEEFEIYGQRVAADSTQTGLNDFRISTAGTDGDLFYDAGLAEVAYNSLDHEYLVVWAGDDDVRPLVEGEVEIFGQRIDAITGAEVGANDFRISRMGPDGDREFEANKPAVAYNRADNVYLVVWEGDDDTPPLVDEEYEIFGQLIDGATGAEVGPDDFRISDAGPDGVHARDALKPAVAYDTVNDRFLVAWEADDSDVGTPNHKNEIYGQLIDGATGAEFGPNDFRISTMAQQDDPDRDGREPAVAFSHPRNEFLVVWRGEDDGMAIDEYEVFGQRIDAATAAEVGSDDFRISEMGPDGDTVFDAVSVAVVHNTMDDEYLVVWRGDDDTNGVDDEFEIFGQLLDGEGVEIGADDFRISDMGPDGDATFDAVQPSLIYNRASNEYLVAWEGNDDVEGAANETEIYVQRLDAGGAEIGPNDLRVTHMGVDGNTAAKAADPAVAFGAPEGTYLIAWEGDPATGGMSNEEYEIFGGMIESTPCPADLDGDDDVGITDLLDLLAQWGTDPGGPPDFDGDGDVGITDLLELLGAWGPCG